jgi:alcohol dehydrogenase class IV
VLLVTGRNPTRSTGIARSLESAGLGVTPFAVSGEPSISIVQEGVQHAKRAGCDLVISLGGGSAIDAGKAIAAMLANPGELLDYLEVIGRGQALPAPSLPFIALPTTAGTGSEVTRNAVLASPEHRVKVSLRSPSMLPKAAIVDPELTFGLPAAVTAATGLDALTQLIEPYLCARANPMIDALCLEGIDRAARSLRACVQRDTPEARTDMSLAALFGGLALANAGLGAVHGFAGPIGGMFDAPHGAVCGLLLPAVMETNLAALKARSPAHPAVPKYDLLAKLLTSEPSATADQGIHWVRQLVAELGIPRLSSYGIRSQDVTAIVPKAAAASSMKANPIVLTPEELSGILERAL